MEEEVEEEEELEDEKEEEEEDIKLLQREVHSRRAALRKRWSKWANNITLLQRSPPNFQGILKTLLTQVRKQVKVRHREESEYKTEQVHSCTCGKV